jgi:hypothetical protein
MRHPALRSSPLDALSGREVPRPKSACAYLVTHSFLYAFPPLSPRAAAYAPLLLCCILSYHYKIISSPRRRPEAVLLECVSCALTTGPRRNIIHYSIPPRPAYTRIFVPNFSFNKPFPSAVFFFAPLCIHFSCINKTASAL